MANQVNFKTSTQDAYNKASSKSFDTFYKTSDNQHLYLGDKQLDNVLFDNCLTTVPQLGALDARQGKVLQDQITQLNTKLKNTVKTNLTIRGSTGFAWYEVVNGICFVHMEVVSYTVAHDEPLCWTVPAALNPGDLVFSLAGANGHAYPAYYKSSDRSIRYYFPAYITVERIDATISYPVA